jgi:hypothetical protein
MWDLELANKKADAARRLAIERYGLTSYLRAVNDSYLAVGGPPATDAQIALASSIVEADLARAAA